MEFIHTRGAIRSVDLRKSSETRHWDCLREGERAGGWQDERKMTQFTPFTHNFFESILSSIDSEDPG